MYRRCVQNGETVIGGIQKKVGHLRAKEFIGIMSCKMIQGKSYKECEASKDNRGWKGKGVKINQGMQGDKHVGQGGRLIRENDNICCYV